MLLSQQFLLHSARHILQDCEFNLSSVSTHEKKNASVDGNNRQLTLLLSAVSQLSQLLRGLGGHQRMQQGGGSVGNTKNPTPPRIVVKKHYKYIIPSSSPYYLVVVLFGWALNLGRCQQLNA
jgi:hypothetical protein